MCGDGGGRPAVSVCGRGGAVLDVPDDGTREGGMDALKSRDGVESWGDIAVSNYQLSTMEIRGRCKRCHAANSTPGR